MKNKVNPIIDKNDEITMIYESILPAEELEELDAESTVDVYIKKPTGEEFFIDITTVKNNLKSFEALKEKLLRWVALRLSTDSDAIVNTFIALPYNPYHPNDYLSSRWNSIILDPELDILVQNDYWNFVGNDSNTYEELLEIFAEVGQEITDEIANFFDNL